jgi:hypothetical protein
VVVENLDELVQIQMKLGGTTATRMINFDTDNVAPHEKAQNHYRNHVEYYKLGGS